ncbi:A/G-specific adenine glycosylase [Lutibacter sp. TH_r2]|uniref:A/G-specific adenine glycosylase n=1 Tax=Lutibacter sp. TH_r2 TaxID=3082083 RepID=UPI002954BA8A|nr:A/G-specific adenine glycosylase [Lutibacter sp. TH_r2]MDV7186279.1 A/G-specific adenine glycosylase [Lutibacter sp. TH_r2]
MKFSKQLIPWYLQNKRDLPWRKTKNPYKIWLSEIILQQTRIDQGMSYYLKFVAHFPTVFELANASEEQVLKLWQGLGYYSRARNLHYSANYVVNELKGEFPSTYKELLKLKGVGDYTASAIASICFNEASATVDGNVYRALSRYFGIETAINSSKGIKEFKALAQELIDKKQPGNFNQALMEFGATVCKPQNPTCTICVFNSSCKALQTNTIAKLPFKEKKLKIRNRYFNYLVIQTLDKKTVLEKRTSGIWKNMYQFPLIETESEVDEQEFLQHNSFDTLFNKAITIQLFNKESIVHKLSHQHIYTRFWVVKTDEKFSNSLNWSEVSKYPVPKLVDNFLEQYNNN